MFPSEISRRLYLYLARDIYRPASKKWQDTDTASLGILDLRCTVRHGDVEHIFDSGSR